MLTSPIPGAIRGEGAPHPQGGAELQGPEDEAMRQQIAQAEDGGHMEPDHLGRERWGWGVGIGLNQDGGGGLGWG